MQTLIIECWQNLKTFLHQAFGLNINKQIGFPIEVVNTRVD